jgi:transketolase
VKPLDQDFLKGAFNRFKLVATIEEHSLIGGFGAAVSEWLSDSRTTNLNLMRFGTPDAFFKKSGEQEYAREMLGLSAHQIADRIIHALH